MSAAAALAADASASSRMRKIGKRAKEKKEEEQKEKYRQQPAMWAQCVAGELGLKPKDVKATVEAVLTFAAEHASKSGSFKLACMLKLKAKYKPARPFNPKGVNPFTKEHCVIKAKPAHKAVTAIPLNRLKELFL